MSIHQAAESTRVQSPLELWQFRLSMYPEKVRWALDHKGIPYILHSLMPGPHAIPMLLRTGQKQVPVIRHGSTLVKGSAAIIDYLEQHGSGPSLYPEDPVLREQALALQQWFDAYGPHVRRAFFAAFLPATDCAADLFSIGYPPRVRALYRATFPVTRTIMQLDMGIHPARVAEGYRKTKEALDFVAQHINADGYLVGGQFSIADLTAAVILFALVFPEQYPVTFASPRPAAVEQWLSHWAGHPATAWVRESYRRYRGHSCAIEDHNG